MNNKRLISLTICWILVVILGLCVLSFADNESGTNTKAEQHFQKANELHILADYDAAITEYKTVISLSPNSKIAQNAQYWIGQLYLESGQLDAALSAFQKILDEYPASTIVPSTKLMIERVQRAKKYYPLLEAIRKGDTEQVRLLISKGADVNAKDEEDKTPLHHAAQSGKMEVVQLLIKAGADLNCKDEEGQTPLTLARHNWHVDLVKLLVSEGADVDLESAAHLGDLAKVKRFIESDPDVNESQLNQLLAWSLNYESLLQGHKDVADYLLDKGANPNGKIKKNEATILHDTAWGGDTALSKSVIEFLVSRGADVNALQGESRWTPLHSACTRGHGSLAKVLIDNGANVNAKDKWGNTPLNYAVRNRANKDVVELLIEKGADVNTKGGSWTPLHSACYRGRGSVAKVLIDNGANVKAVDRRGNTPLHYAVRNNDLGTVTVSLLIAKGADINAKSNIGGTPLHAAVDNDKKDVAELLIAKGANVNSKINRGMTPLHLAAYHGNKDVAELLIAHKANVDGKDKAGVTPLGLAEENGHSETAELLRKYGAKISVGVGETPLHEAVKIRDTIRVKSLIAGGANVNAKNIYGYTPLHLTCMFGRKNQAELLIAADADVNVKDKDGHTPLWHAKDRGNTELAELLRKHGAKE